MAAQGDIKKMYNAVKLVEEDCYVQCFLWRNMDENGEAKMYQITVNNIGVKPAGVIAATALYKSAAKFEGRYPKTVKQLREQSYMDDIGLTDTKMDILIKKNEQADKVLDHAGMKIKKWIFSGDDQNNVEVGSITDKLTTEDVELE